MDALMHMIGICGDAQSHLDLIELVVGGGLVGVLSWWRLALSRWRVR